LALPKDYDIKHLKWSGRYRGGLCSPWPAHGTEFRDTAWGCIRCLRYLQAELKKPAPRLWATVDEAAEWIGLPMLRILNRVVAACHGAKELWPWTRVEVDKRNLRVKIFTPDLLEELLWVTRRDGMAFLGTSPDCRHLRPYEKWLHRTHRYFRGTYKENNALWLPGVIHVAGLKKLRGLFGQRCSLDEYEALAELSPERVAHLRLSPFTADRLKD